MSCDQSFDIPVQFFLKRPDRLSPFKSESPNLVLEALDEEYAFAFNYLNPSGVVLLRSDLRREVQEYIQGGKLCDVRPSVIADSSPVIQRLLLVKPPATEKTLNFWIHITDSCNLGCYYCYIDDIDRFQSKAREAMSAETAKAILERVRTEAVNAKISCVHFKFAGGEPFLALDAMREFCKLADSILPASQFKISYGVITNGVLLVDEALSFVKSRQVNISISLDGNEDSHNKTRYALSGKKRLNTWHQVLLNIDLLLDHGIVPYVLHTVTASNISGLNEFQHVLSEKNIGFRLSLVRLSTNPSDSSSLKFQNELINFYDGLPEKFPLNLRIERDARFAEWNPSRSKQLACGSARNYFSIDVQGKLASCQMAAKRPLADLTKDEIQTGRSNAATRSDTKALVTPSLRSGGCMDCYYRHTCAGGCPQHTLTVSGTMSSPSPWCGLYGSLYPVYVRAIARHRLKVLRAAGKI